MKKACFIPILALTALLAACDLFGGKMKAPSFDKEGGEVTYSEFTSALQEAVENSEVADTNSLLGDRYEKASVSQAEINTVKKDKKEISKSDRQMTSKSEAQYDADNLVAKVTGEAKTTYKYSDDESSNSETSTRNTENYLQFEKINGLKTLVTANAKSKVYYSTASVNSNQTEEKVFDNTTRSDMSSIFSVFSYSVPSSQSDAKEYLFYINNDVLFTLSQNTDTEDNDNPNFTLTTKVKLKAQIDFTSKKEAFRYSYEYKTEYTYKRNYEGHLEGEVVTNERKAYAEYVFTGKSVTVKPVDLDDYTLSN